jgi:putative chitinase
MEVVNLKVLLFCFWTTNILTFMINRQKFYATVRNHFGKLRQSQVDGFEAILNEWEASGLTDLRWLAYMLATAWHETGKRVNGVFINTMQPVEEVGKGKGRPYGKPSANGKVHYGRGHVQLTWPDNYKKMGKILGIDLYNNPEKALEMQTSVKILFEGMTTGKSFKGDFTGKHLGNYFNKTKEDWFNARRIINGTDKASKIGGEAQVFYSALV